VILEAWLAMSLALPLSYRFLRPFLPHASSVLLVESPKTYQSCPCRCFAEALNCSPFFWPVGSMAVQIASVAISVTTVACKAEVCRAPPSFAVQSQHRGAPESGIPLIKV
jgi:hypothetical protein